MCKLRFLCAAIIVFASVVQSGRTQPPQDDPFAPRKHDSTAAEAESDSPEENEDPQVRALRELGARFLTKGFKSSWSPDGKRLVFGHQEAPYAKEGGGLSILDVATGETTRLVKSGKDPSWAPGDGRYIAYIDGGYGADEQIWIVEPSGENRRKVVDGGFPSWSPDGKTIFFHSRKQRKFMAVNIDQDGVAPTEIMDSIWWYPVFSFDGKRIAFRSGDQLVLADRETGTTVKQYQIPGGRGFLGSWSPDGRYVSYGGYGFHDVPGLWIVDVQTGDLKQLSEGFVTMPVWSPDGSKISMDLRLRSGFEVWIIDASVVDGLPKVVHYAVPEGGVDELLRFIENLQEFRPATPRERAEHQSKAQAALKLAAMRILAQDKDRWSKPSQTALRVLLKIRITDIPQADQRQQGQTVEFVKTFLKAKRERQLESLDVDLATSAARALEICRNLELAAQAYDQFADLIAESGNKEFSRTVQDMKDAAKRLSNAER